MGENGNDMNEGPEKWEIFAWAVRDVMSIASGIPKSEMHLRDKIKYEMMMGFRE